MDQQQQNFGQAVSRVRCQPSSPGIAALLPLSTCASLACFKPYVICANSGNSFTLYPEFLPAGCVTSSCVRNPRGTN